MKPLGGSSIYILKSDVSASMLYFARETTNYSIYTVFQ